MDITDFESSLQSQQGAGYPHKESTFLSSHLPTMVPGDQQGESAIEATAYHKTKGFYQRDKSVFPTDFDSCLEGGQGDGHPT